MSFKANIIEEMQYLVAVYYLLDKNATDDWKVLQDK